MQSSDIIGKGRIVNTRANNRSESSEQGINNRTWLNTKNAAAANTEDKDLFCVAEGTNWQWHISHESVSSYIDIQDENI